MDFTLADVRHLTAIYLVGCVERYKKRVEMKYPDSKIEWNDDDDIGHLIDHMFIEQLENNLWRFINVVREKITFEIENITADEVVIYVHKFSDGLLIDCLDYP